MSKNDNKRLSIDFFGTLKNIRTGVAKFWIRHWAVVNNEIIVNTSSNTYILIKRFIFYNLFIIWDILIIDLDALKQNLGLILVYHFEILGTFYFWVFFGIIDYNFIKINSSLSETCLIKLNIQNIKPTTISYITKIFNCFAFYSSYTIMYLNCLYSAPFIKIKIFLILKILMKNV